MSFSESSKFFLLQLNAMEERITPLQEEIRNAMAQKEAAQNDSKAAFGEVERWKTRTNQLIEQSHKTDPEEHKRLMWVNRNTITSLVEDFILTLYSTDTHDNNRQLLKTLWEKEKLLVTSDFSFSHNVFYSIW